MNLRSFLLLFQAVSVFTLTGIAADPTVKLITLDPGHFHAGLVQKSMYPQVSPVVHVYAPGGAELQEHLKRIDDFNKRAEDPTHWEEKVYTGAEFLDRMIKEKSGNVVVISGNNARKAEYIYKSVGAGLNVLADKPMVITPGEFSSLRKAFATAEKRKVLLYDIMTERFEITAQLQRELARMPVLFGTFEKGSASDPAIVMESIHHYYKEVAGKPLIRPAWFFDIRQQGEAIPDIGTHLVDLVHWQCFPDQTLDYKRDVKVLDASRWPTVLTPEQFKRATGLDKFPDYLKKDVVTTGNLEVFQNGNVTWAIRGVHAKVTALWNFEAPPGTKDTHYAMFRGTKGSLTIRQGKEENYQPILYIDNRSGAAPEQFEATVRASVSGLCSKWPGLEVKPAGKAWQIVVPAKYVVGHEAHFAQVTEKYLQYLAGGNLPSWEVPNMLAKYYITTEAYRLGHQKQAR